MKSLYGRCAWVVTVGLLLFPTASSAQTGQTPLHGFTAFPYDLTQEAVDRVHEIVIPNSNLFAVHMDQCLPWREALEGRPFPGWMQNNFKEVRSRVPSSHTIYVAMTPTAVDRHGFAKQCGAKDDQELPVPSAIRGKSFDHPLVKKAYVNYVRRVVQALKPKFINIGIEISELSLKHPRDWPAFEALYLHTLKEIKRSHPNVKVGMEMVLQSLMLPRVANQVKAAVEQSDYIGISFYPYGSAYGKFFGAPGLPSGNDQWRQPLDWLRQYTKKPIAICETGYSTKPFTLREGGGIRFEGSHTKQRTFLRDLIQFAKRDNYLFTVWFVPIDYERLLSKYPGAVEWMKIWVNAGLFDKNLQPKPAWAEWQGWKKPATGAPSAAPRAAAAAAPSTPLDPNFKIASSGDLFSCSANTTAALDSGPNSGLRSMKWKIKYTGDWATCTKVVPSGATAGKSGLNFWIKSDKQELVLLRLDQHNDKVFYTLVDAGPGWTRVTRNLSDFKSSTSPQSSQKPDPDQLKFLMFGDGAGADGARGTRTIWVSGINFF